MPAAAIGLPRAPFRPLEGLTVVEFSQMVMGPACGLILADLGANVIKVEPLQGDRTRKFGGPAAGFFAMYCRNKNSLAIDANTADGQTILRRLIAQSDVLIENFRPGLLARIGLDYDTVSTFAPSLVYCSLKGYLPGPYENRLALDEVVQMMGGLAYMTGLPDRPMRAGASVNDVMGGMFGVIAIQAALAERATTGRGRLIQSALFENNVFLMGQAMMFETVTGGPSIPYSTKDSPWPVYDLFDTADNLKLFVTIVGEEHWQAFCKTFGREIWLNDLRMATGQGRVDQRSWMIPEIADIFRSWKAADLAVKLEAIGLPFAPVNKPGDLFADHHLNVSGGFHDITLTDGRHAKTPALPISIDGIRLGNRRNPPDIGADTRQTLQTLGYTGAEIDAFEQNGTVSSTVKS